MADINIKSLNDILWESTFFYFSLRVARLMTKLSQKRKAFKEFYGLLFRGLSSNEEKYHILPNRPCI